MTRDPAPEPGGPLDGGAGRKPWRLALIGCGAVTRNAHVRVAAASPDFEVTAAVDAEASRAVELAARWSVPWAGRDYREVAGRADAAIVATPHHLHASMTRELLRQGLHVLVEKPMALTREDADAMIDAAAQADRTLAVGLVRRHYAPSAFVKHLVDSGVLGPLLGFSVVEGGVYSWQLASPFMFRREAAGGGALADLGVHVLDLLLWWLGDPEGVEYRDDAAGGMEAECELRLWFEGGATGTVLLTRLREVPAGWSLEFERGRLQMVPGPGLEPDLRLTLRGSNVPLADTRDPEARGATLEAVFRRQLDDFARALHTGAPPLVSGTEGRRSVALLERCYEVRRPLAYPWAGAPASPPSRTGKRRKRAPEGGGEPPARCALVTGATGFIGGRTVERLAEEGVRVRALVRTLARAARISRFGPEIVHGDVTDPEAVRRAAEGCDLVVHCAYGSDGNAERQRTVNLEGTRNVLEAAADAGARRVVHLSTVEVYGDTPEGSLDETAPRAPTGHPYGDSKLEAENLVLERAAGGLPATVVQPAVVYGPFAPVWTTSVLQQLRSGHVILVEGGQGTCNPVYVDDVVQAILLAAAEDAAVGRSFLVSGPEAVTWKEFYGRFERMLGGVRTVEMTVEEAAAHFESTRRPPPARFSTELVRAVRENPELRARLVATPEMKTLWRVARSLMPEQARRAIRGRMRREEADLPGAAAGAADVPRNEGSPPATIHPLSPDAAKLFTRRTTVSTERARTVLGYRSRWSLDEGMRMTEAWARWAGLLPPAGKASAAGRWGGRSRSPAREARRWS